MLMANQSRPKAIMGYLAASMAGPAFTARFATDLVRPDLLERICGKRLICADTLRKALAGDIGDSDE